MEGITRSGKKYTKIFSIDSSSDSDSNSQSSIYAYTMSSSPSSPTPGSPDFDRKVEEQVQRTIRAMIASGTLNPASPTSVTTYVTDPFKGDFNPADKHGASLFKTATEPLPEKDRFSLNQDNAKKVFHLLKSKASTFFWGTSVTKIPQSYPISATTCKNLLTSSNRVSLDSVKRDAARCWAKKTDATDAKDFEDHILRPDQMQIAPIDPNTSNTDKVLFYERTRRVMIAKTIIGILKDAAIMTLSINKKHWTWKDGDEEYEDGPTMLKFLFLDLDPSTTINLEKYKTLLENAKLPAYGNCINTLLSKMQLAYDHIIENDGTHDDFLRHVFKALFTTSNPRFKTYIQQIHDKYITDMDSITVSELMTQSKNMYNNLVKLGEWGKADPRDAKLLALQTQLSKMKTSPADSSNIPIGPVNPDPKKLNPARKVKTQNESMMFDGQQMWWCSKHVHPKGEFNGLYMPHQEKDHHIWAAEKKKKKEAYNKANAARKAAKGKTTTGSDKPSAKKSPFTISDKLKAALCTAGQMSPDHFDSICETCEDF